MIDARQLGACEGAAASLLAEVNRDCLGSVFDKSPERQQRAMQLLDLLANREQVLNLLRVLGGLSWPTSYGQSPYEEVATVLRCAAQGLALPGGSTPVMRALHNLAIERFAPASARARWNLDEAGRAHRYRRLLRAMQHAALLTPGEADSALRVLLRTNPIGRGHCPASCEAVHHYGGNIATVRAARRWRRRFASTTRLPLAA